MDERLKYEIRNCKTTQRVDKNLLLKPIVRKHYQMSKYLEHIFLNVYITKHELNESVKINEILPAIC